MMKKPIIIYTVFIIVLMFCSTSFAQTKEIEMYNEWFLEDSDYVSERSDRAFFFIRDSVSFLNFWKYTRLSKTPPYLDFDRYMVFVWAPGYTRRDYSKVSFERMLLKDDCLLVFIDFVDNSRQYGSKKKPLKFVILPKVKPCDTFLYRRVKKGWRKYEWKHFYSMWDMSGERKRPFEIVMIEQDKEEQIVLATYTPELTVAANTKQENDNVKESVPVEPAKPKVRPVAIVSTAPIQAQPAQPVAVQPRQPTTQTQITQSQPRQQTQTVSQKTQPSKPTGVVSDAPIDFGGGSKPSVDQDTRPTSVPGMIEDPLFGSEFDITF